MGGAGHKCVRVALNDIDCYISQGLDFWDVCGGEVIVKALGGHVSDYIGNPLIYEESPVHKTWFYNGVVVAKSEKVFKAV